MNYLKGTLTAIDKDTLDKIMKQVYTTDYTKQLNEYAVEYQVLQEEMLSVQPQVESLHKLEALNKTLEDRNKALTAQLELALSNVQRLEKTRTLQQSQINKLEVQSRSADVTIGTLATFIHDLIEDKADIEVPGDVRRIISQFNFAERMQSEKKNSSNFMNMFKKANESNSRAQANRLMVKSLSTGKIGLGAIADQSEMRSNSLNPNELKPRNSFFSNSHSQILQQRLQKESPLVNSKVDITIQDYVEEENNKNELKNIEIKTPILPNPNLNMRSIDLTSAGQTSISTSDSNRENIRKSESGSDKSESILKNLGPINVIANSNADKMNLNLKGSVDINLNKNARTTPEDPNKIANQTKESPKSPTPSIDSGVSSPKDLEPHPLSNCDVNFTFHGTRELKTIKSLRNMSRNSSPDMIAK